MFGMVSELVSALILAIVQGATEWFPISSSGHLVLFENILGFSGGLAFSVALHFGTLMAVFVYFGKDITDILRDLLVGNWKSQNGRLGILIAIATIPAGIVGFLVKDLFDNVFTSLGVTALGFGITGLFLFIASLNFNRRRLTRPTRTRGSNYISKILNRESSPNPINKRLISKNRSSQDDLLFSNKLSYGKAFLVGIAQALAIVPGISRSGSTISAGVLLGLDEKHAMKFAFLMAIPVIFGANILVVGNNTLPPEMIWAALVSFVVGLLSIHVVFKYVLTDRKNFRWFAVYCLLLALVLGIYVLVV